MADADLQFILSEKLFQTIFEKSPGSLLVRANFPFFTIQAVSDTYLEVTNTSREVILNRGFFDVFPDNETDTFDDTSARNVFSKVIQTREKIVIPVYRYDIYNEATNKMEMHYWSCTNAPIPDSEGNVAYILNTIIDITGEVQAKQAAIESETRLRLAAEATGFATFDWDLQNKDLICSPRLVELFGHSPNTQLNAKVARNQVHADDVEIITNAFQQALKTGIYTYDVRISWPDGSLHWIRTQGKLITDEHHKPIRMLGTVLDITTDKLDEIRKNDFIAMASHELKTPLTSLKAYLQVATAKIAKTDDAFLNHALLKAGHQVNKMTNLIHGFLDLSKFESGKLQVNSQHFDLNKLIEDVIAESLLINNSHTIKFIAATELINVNADKEKIGQVVSNLLSNAVKYSPKGSTIKVSTKLINGKVQVAVNDKGIGIKPKDQEKLFQRFYRVENENLKQVAGFGIGLYLASEIIQRHDGEIWVESEENKGSTFYFSLPAA